MEAHDKQGHGVPTVEVMAALKDFARLSLQGTIVTSDSLILHDTTATTLLERLLLLCGAQRGAVIITTQYHTGLQRFSPSSLSNRQLYRTYALRGMSEKDVSSLLQTLSPEGEDIQMIADGPEVPDGAGGLEGACWLLWKRAIALPPVTQQDRYLGYSMQVGAEWDYQRPYSTLALFLFGWPDAQATRCATVLKKTQSILPYIADSVEAVIMHMLLTERVHDLETSVTRRALSEMELLKAELLATVSHELRSPLASIKGYAATLLRHDRRISREERQEFLIAITDASKRLEVVIDRLLEMSQLETGNTSLECTTVNIAHLVREAVTALQQRLEAPEALRSVAEVKREIAFSLLLEDSAGQPTKEELLIQADRQRLREVFDHILENAILYSPDSGMIEVRMRPTLARDRLPPALLRRSRAGDDEEGDGLHYRDDDQMVEIRVHDNGIGISTEHLEHIFDRFYRVDTRLTREVNGLGLGLAISKRIIEMHGGLIWAESHVGKGSSFYILLPVEGRNGQHPTQDLLKVDLSGDD